MSAAKPTRTLVTMPLDMAERVHQHRIRGGFRSENAAAVDLVRSGLDWFENRERYDREQREAAALSHRLRHWGASIP